MNIKKVLVFQHLRKTGGSTVRELLRPFFWTDKSIDANKLLPTHPNIVEAMEGIDSRSFVHGHVEMLSSSPAGAFKFAFFRGPYQRLLSDRRQWMRGRDQLSVGPDADALAAMRDKSLREILTGISDHPIIISSFWNYQTTTLGAWPLIRETRPERPSTYFAYRRMHEHFSSGEELLTWLDRNARTISHRAKASVDRLDFIGLTETLDASVADLFGRLGLPAPDIIPVINARASFDDEADPELPSTATAFLELDYDLYEYAKERSDRMRREERGAPAPYYEKWAHPRPLFIVYGRKLLLPFVKGPWRRRASRLVEIVGDLMRGRYPF